MTQVGDERRKNRPQRRATLWALLGVLLLALVLAVVVVSNQDTTPQPKDGTSGLREGGQAPGFALKAAHGGTASSREFRKKDVLLYFSMGPG
jgi:hypothetical protein